MTETYPAFRKIPRLHKPVTITEKIDGTNGLISISREAWGFTTDRTVLTAVQDLSESDPDTGFPLCQWVIRAGSRNRWLSLDSDNCGFAAWVCDNSRELAELGEGNHYGEWWGSGIQRGYGLAKGEKRFSLFNVDRWGKADNLPGCVSVVPVISRGDGSTLNEMVTEALLDLAAFGSQAAPGFGSAEGIVVYHEASRAMYKVTLDGDAKGAPLLARPLRQPANMLKPPELAVAVA